MWLTFVIVDFKGGGGFAELSALPHVAAMVTNLADDLAMVDRVAALSGELERRQRVFRGAGNLDGVRAYHAACADRLELPVLSYLLLVAAAFAELLAARPDFLDLFTAVGRVGRSLGIHLLLSTQRLDEGRLRGLEGRLRYRLCLRTFSAQESHAVLGTAAFALPPLPGLGFLTVDGARFTAALVTTPHGRIRKAAADDARPVAVRPFTLTAGLRRQ